MTNTYSLAPSNRQIFLVLRDIIIILFIFIVLLTVRMPFFFPAMINWDESTFVVVGQSTIDGFLPYQVAWDIKPPGLFWWFGGAISIFGKSIPSIRFACCIWLLLTSYVLYRCAFILTGNIIGSIFSALIVVVASASYALSVSSENLALLPIAAALLVMIRNPDLSIYSIFWAGLFLGTSCVFRPNLFVLCLIMGLFIFIHDLRSSYVSWRLLQRGAVFSAAVIAPTLLTFLPYLLVGDWQAWVTFYKAAMAFEASVKPSGARYFAAIAQTLMKSVETLSGALMWGAAVLGIFTLYDRWNYIDTAERSGWAVCGAFFVGSYLSIVMTGTPTRGHYSAQLIPSLSVFAAANALPGSFLRRKSEIETAALYAGAALVVLAILRMSASEWSTLNERFWRGERLSYGLAYDVSEFIRENSPTNYSLFVLDHHIAYWFLGRYPPTLLSTHPSNMRKPSVRQYLEPNSNSTEDSLRRALSKKPTFIVYSSKRYERADYSLLQEQLKANYALLGEVDDAKIFVLDGTPSAQKSGNEARSTDPEK